MAKIIKEINMGKWYDSDILEFMNEKFLRFEESTVFIKPNDNVGIAYPDNGCIEIIFDHDSCCDVIFDSIEEQNEHLEL